MTEPIEIKDLGRVQIAPGDVLFVRAKYAITGAELDYLRDKFKGIFPDNRVIVSGPEVEYFLVTKGEDGRAETDL